jgi:hypothetical protein
VNPGFEPGSGTLPGSGKPAPGRGNTEPGSREEGWGGGGGVGATGNGGTGSGGAGVVGSVGDAHPGCVSSGPSVMRHFTVDRQIAKANVAPSD